jgi:hypothetical protein
VWLWPWLQEDNCRGIQGFGGKVELRESSQYRAKSWGRALNGRFDNLIEHAWARSFTTHAAARGGVEEPEGSLQAIMKSYPRSIYDL